MGGTYYLINNTFVNDATAGVFLWTRSGSTAIAKNNLFMGTGTVTGPGTVTETNDLRTADALLANRSTFDYHLTASSPAVNAGTAVGSLTPTLEYSHPRSSVSRATVGTIDIGAYEQQSCVSDVTAQFTVARGGFRLNAATQRFVQTVTLTSHAGGVLQGPVSLVLTSLSANATLAGNPPSTACVLPVGSRFVNAAAVSLSPGDSTTVTLEFENPTKAGITYTPLVFAGAGER